MQKLDLTKHEMLYEGPLTWRLSRTKQIDLHGVLLEHILVLLQRQDERFVLRCQSMTVVAGKEDTKFTHSPIIKLNNLLTRSVATGMLKSRYVSYYYHNYYCYCNDYYKAQDCLRELSTDK